MYVLYDVCMYSPHSKYQYAKKRLDYESHIHGQIYSRNLPATQQDFTKGAVRLIYQ